MFSVPNNYLPFQLNIGVRHSELLPSVAFNKIIVYYWCVENTSQSPIDFPIVADGCVDIIYGYATDSEFYVSLSLYTLKNIKIKPGQKIFGARFFPSVFSSIFGLPMSVFSNLNMINLKEVEITKSLRWIFESGVNIAGLAELKNIIERCLYTILNNNKITYDSHLYTALDHIYTQKGNVRIQNQRKFTVSPRQLRRIFIKYTGFSPKEFSHIVLMQNAIKDIKMDNYHFSNYGFYDQSHFIREIKKYTGFIPTKLIRHME